MSGQEDSVLEQLYKLIADDWAALRASRRTVADTQKRLATRVAEALKRGASGRSLERKSGIPESNIRRWANQLLSEHH